MRIKNIGTLSKKLKMPEITDKERAEAALMVEMQKVRSGITEFWKRLVVSVVGDLGGMRVHHIIM